MADIEGYLLSKEESVWLADFVKRSMAKRPNQPSKTQHEKQWDVRIDHPPRDVRIVQVEASVAGARLENEDPEDSETPLLWRLSSTTCRMMTILNPTVDEEGLLKPSSNHLVRVWNVFSSPIPPSIQIIAKENFGNWVFLSQALGYGVATLSEYMGLGSYATGIDHGTAEEIEVLGRWFDEDSGSDVGWIYFVDAGGNTIRHAIAKLCPATGTGTGGAMQSMLMDGGEPLIEGDELIS